MDKESLIAYISKLNERNLQRQRASGFTIWAIIGVFVFLILDLIDKIIEINSSVDLKLYLVIILSGLSFVCISITLLMVSLTMYSKSNSIRRFDSTIYSKSFLINFVPLSLVFLVLSFTSLKAAGFAATINISPWIFWAFFLGFAVNGIYPFINKLYQIRKSSKAKIPYPEISMFSLRTKRLTSIIYAIFAIVILLCVYLTYQSISLPLKDQQISLLIKTSIEILGSFIIFIAIFWNIGSSNRHDWLENLEMEIYLNNLTESQIVEKLESEYIGIDIFKWILKRQEKHNTTATKFFNSLKEETPKIEELKKIDGSFKHEIAGRRDEICKRVNNIFNEYISVVRKSSFQLREIMRQGLPDKEESAEIEKSYNEWNKQTDNVENSYKEFCKCCQLTCSRKL